MISNNIRRYWEICKRSFKRQFCICCAFIKGGDGMMNPAGAETRAVSGWLATCHRASHLSSRQTQTSAPDEQERRHSSE